MTWLFAVTVFVSAFLGFALQPMIGRMILPKFGGAPAVWNTAIVFFQLTLLAGYFYAHVLATWVRVRWAAVLHLAIIGIGAVTLPIVVAGDWAPPVESNPAPYLLGCLLLAVGLPYLIVSTGAPLLHHWFTAAAPEARNPYRLYAASNVGSFFGLLCYPALIEPNLTLSQQSRFWSIGYGILATLVGSCAVVVWLSRRESPSTPPADNAESNEPVAPVGIWTRFRWVLLAFVPSSLLQGVTTYLTTDVAPIPLLWVIPLGLYLLTFTIAFGKPPSRWHQYLVWCLPVLIVMPLVGPYIPGDWHNSMFLQIVLHLAPFTAIAVVFHRELARCKPPASAASGFYLWIAFGGVLGGAFNALLAPLLFSTLLEYKLVLLLAAVTMPRWHCCVKWFSDRRQEWAMTVFVGLLVALFCLSSATSAFWQFGAPILVCALFLRRPLTVGLGVATVFFVALASGAATKGFNEICRGRSFFGTYSVLAGERGNFHLLYHGRTVHGAQIMDKSMRHIPLCYYDPTGPVGSVFIALRSDTTKPKLSPVGIVGLGAGAIAAYGHAGEEFTFFEIDPAMEQVARTQFTYLEESKASCRVVLGDARQSMVNEPDGKYGLIVVDAFNSDAIPTHLLTSEAIALFRSKLTDTGLIAIHISNRHLDLEPVVVAVARANKLTMRSCNDETMTPAAASRGKHASRWVVLANRQGDLNLLSRDPRWQSFCRKFVRPWTDDYCNVLGAFDFELPDPRNLAKLFRSSPAETVAAPK
jgi:hypothetical protein